MQIFDNDANKLKLKVNIRFHEFLFVVDFFCNVFYLKTRNDAVEEKKVILLVGRVNQIKTDNKSLMVLYIDARNNVSR